MGKPVWDYNAAFFSVVVNRLITLKIRSIRWPTFLSE
jgi:hypothetical protein